MQVFFAIAALVSGQRTNVSTSARRVTPAMFESLEGRQMLSASPHVKAASPTETPHAVHAAQSVVRLLYNFVGKAKADGSSAAKSVVLSFFKDENGQVTAKLGGDGLGLKDVQLAGTHSGSSYVLSFSGAAGSVAVNATIGADGTSVSGTFSFTHEKKTVTGTLTAQKSVPTPAPEPTPTPTPTWKPAPKPAPVPANPTVHYTVLSKFHGDFTPDGVSHSVGLGLTVARTSDGHDILIVESATFGKNPTFVLYVSGEGKTFTGSGKGEHGTTTMSVTLSDDYSMLSGTVRRTTDGKLVSGMFSLAKIA